MKLGYLVTFCAVVQEGGFSAAARRLHLTQPAVSHQVAALERALGCRLLDRGGKPPVLTEAGQRLYPHIEGCVDAYRRVEATAHRLQQGEAELRLSTIYTVGELLLPSLLTSFRRLHPAVVLTVTVGDRNRVSRSVLDGGVDFGISFVVGGDGELPAALRTIDLYDEALCLAVSRQHPWAGPGRLRRRDLAEGEFILRNAGLVTRRLLDSALDTAGLRVLMEVGSNEALRAALKAGLGAGFVYQSALDHDLVAVEVEGLTISRRLVALLPRGTRVRPSVRNFLDLVRDVGRARSRDPAGAPNP